MGFRVWGLGFRDVFLLSGVFSEPGSTVAERAHSPAEPQPGLTSGLKPTKTYTLNPIYIYIYIDTYIYIYIYIYLYIYIYIDVYIYYLPTLNQFGLETH